MSLFVCDHCNTVANTAPDKYWEQSINQAQQGIPPSERVYACSLCRTGEWHGLFPRKEWDGRQPMKNRGNSGPVLPYQPDSG